MDRSGRRAAVALLLLIPAPSLTIWVGLIAYPGQPVGQIGYLIGKLWTLLLPLAWFFCFDDGRRRLGEWRRAPWPDAGVVAAGVLSGALFAAAIVIAFELFAADALDPALLRRLLSRAGVDGGAVFLAFALYWTLINALLEEVVWRGFVLAKLRVLVAPGAALWLCAVAFSAHHAVATWPYLGAQMIVLVALASAVAGAVWCALTLRFQTLWPAYLSHIIADVAIFACAYRLLYGGG